MSCFDDLIGVKSGCSVIEGSSGIYIEDLGITCNEVDNYVNDEYENGQALIQDKIKFAAKIVSKTIQNNFASAIQTRQFLSSLNLGQYQDNLQLQNTVAGSLGGLNINLLNNSSYLDIYINSISLQVNTSANVDVLVYNLMTGLLVDTITIPCVANQISVKVVNKSYSSNRQRLDLIFVYDVSTIASYKCQLDYMSAGMYCPSCAGYQYKNYYIASTPILIGSTDQKIRQSLTSQNHNYGMSLNYSVQCNIENWLCNMSNFMALPIAYKAAEEIMNYATMVSSRNNSETNISFEANQKRADFFNTQFLEHINSSIKNIMLPKNDICFLCSNPVVSKIILP